MKYLQTFHDAVRKARAPLTASLELLSPCNLRCLHCYVTHTKKTALKLPVVIDVLDQLRAAGTINVTLTGGEIGLRKDLFDIIAAARERRFQVQLLSSGTRWGEKEWDRLAELGVAGVRFSVYGSCAVVHDKVTLIAGSFERTIASALGLRARGVDVGLSCSVMNINAHDIGNLIGVADQHSLSVMIDPTITLTDAGDAAPAATRATYGQLVAMYRDPRVRAKYYSDDPCGAPAGSKRPCGVGEVGVFIRSTGDVFPCSRWPKSAGNVLERSLLDIFRDSEVFQRSRAITVASLTGCSGCGDASTCGRCAAVNLQEMGAIERPSETICLNTAARSEAFYGASKQHRSFRASLPIVG